MSWSIAHHKKLRTKKESTFGKKKTILKLKAKVPKKDLDYMGWLRNHKYLFVCMVCDSKNVEFHHVKRDSTDKKNHKRLIPLCQNHHTVSNELSAHGTPKKFREFYPMDYQNKIADKIHNRYKLLLSNSNVNL
jgi:hypothetical protein